MRFSLAGLALAAAVSLFAGSAAAVPITGLFATGVDGSGNALAGGVNDPHYTVLENAGAAAVTMSSVPGFYIPNNATSRWVWQNANGQPTHVTRTFRLSLDLTGLDHLTAAISGQWAVDNRGDDILINGISTGNFAGVLNVFTAFNINGGFVAGVNTLDFVVRDWGGIAAFRVGNISGTADTLNVPEPATLGLFGLGLAGLGFAARRRKSA